MSRYPKFSPLKRRRQTKPEAPKDAVLRALWLALSALAQLEKLHGKPEPH